MSGARLIHVRRAVLAALGLVWLFPTYLIVANAVRPAGDYDPSDAVKPPSSIGLFDNIAQAWDRTAVGDTLLSTLLYSVVSPALAVLMGALAGYAIVVLRLRHGFAWFVVIFAGTVVPFQMLLVPLFVGYSKVTLYDDRLGLIIIYSAINVPLAALVMRNFFGNVAVSIFEAARLDGASTFRIFWRIYLPLSAAALAAVFILEFTFVWNDLLFGLTLSQSPTVRPVWAELSALTTDVYAGTPVPIALAAGLVVSLPTVAIFLATQRLFTRGLTLAQF
ncbi:carbohydrate ABC transporter permease [Actinomadura sp. NPDC048955]|uniref:Multiple sugar transport system permease protein n=1 Tax=Actinomadura luteofluorescens TaxID=46163 RepID=A0A7Y9EEZ5_9ACTN|nr:MULTISPECIES: carbohydrate ABC transporter permease [Actinomadura]MCR3741130.1 multiple sugar transport system permease protein [Actinomadura glauciflava]NYD46276.1 multiple sugar transport system permease protein [Actinomadura luteofluorescens]